MKPKPAHRRSALVCQHGERQRVRLTEAPAPQVRHAAHGRFRQIGRAGRFALANLLTFSLIRAHREFVKLLFSHGNVWKCRRFPRTRRAIRAGLAMMEAERSGFAPMANPPACEIDRKAAPPGWRSGSIDTFRANLQLECEIRDHDFGNRIRQLHHHGHFRRKASIGRIGLRAHGATAIWFRWPSWRTPASAE